MEVARPNDLGRDPVGRLVFRLAIPSMLETLEINGFEKNYIFEKATGDFFKVPPCRYVAEFVYRNRSRNLLLSGTTGSGKSTSASFVAMQMLKNSDLKIKYFTLRKLLAEWRSAKTSDKDFVSEKMPYPPALPFFIGAAAVFWCNLRKKFVSMRQSHCIFFHLVVQCNKIGLGNGRREFIWREK